MDGAAKQREEQSFPSKTEDDLKLQYNDYLNKQRDNLETQPSSECSRPEISNQSVEVVESRPLAATELNGNGTIDNIMNKQRLEFLKKLWQH